MTQEDCGYLDVCVNILKPKKIKGTEQELSISYPLDYYDPRDERVVDDFWIRLLGILCEVRSYEALEMSDNLSVRHFL